MSTPTHPRTGADVMAQFIPSSPFVAKLGIIADVLDADEVRLRLPWDPTNVTIDDMVHGGAIALGHPLGASGTKLMTTLIHALHSQGKRYGLQTMCEGGGMANVTIVERL